MLLILSPASVNSTNVMDEVSYALEEKKTVIPVMLRDCAIPFRLRRVQHVDFRQEYPGALKRLLNILIPEQEAGQNSPVDSDIHPPHQNDLSQAEERKRAGDEAPRKDIELQRRVPGQARTDHGSEPLEQAVQEASRNAESREAREQARAPARGEAERKAWEKGAEERRVARREAQNGQPADKGEAKTPGSGKLAVASAGPAPGSFACRQNPSLGSPRYDGHRRDCRGRNDDRVTAAECPFFVENLSARREYSHTHLSSVECADTGRYTATNTRADEETCSPPFQGPSFGLA